MRVVCLPGESLKFDGFGELTVDGKTVVKPVELTHVKYFQSEQGCHSKGINIVPSGCYFILGDNSHNAFDSRHFGTVDLSRITHVFRAGK